MNQAVSSSRRRALQFFASAPLLPLSTALTGSSVLLAACGGSDSPALAAPAFSSVSFSNMAAANMATPASTAAMATTTVGSVLSVNFSDSSKVDFKLAYQPFFITGDLVADGKGSKTLAGGYYDINNQAIMDTTVAGKSRQYFSDSPDGTSLLKIDGAKVTGVTGNTVFAVVQFEYTTWAQDGKPPICMASCPRPLPCSRWTRTPVPANCRW
jgi:hypothetical protein